MTGPPRGPRPEAPRPRPGRDRGPAETAETETRGPSAEKSAHEDAPDAPIGGPPGPGAGPLSAPFLAHSPSGVAENGAETGGPRAAPEAARCPVCRAETRAPGRPHFLGGGWCEGTVPGTEENAAPGITPETPPETGAAAAMPYTPSAAAGPPGPPRLTVYGRPVTLADVREALTALGDEAIAAFETGRMDALTGYTLAARRIRASMGLRARRWR